MRFSPTILEEELKLKVSEAFFEKYDCTHILGKVDFSVCIKDNTPALFDNEFLLWGEAKRGQVSDFKTSLVQLILTVGKERTFDRYLPPRFLCEFDSKQIAFIPYDKVMEVFFQNDFNWNVAPSDHNTSEFRQLYELVKQTLEAYSYCYEFDRDEAQLRQFIKSNLKVGLNTIAKTKITKNNFVSIYNRWLDEVKPSIKVRWEGLKDSGIIDADFYLADIMSKDNAPIMDKLQVLLTNDRYILNRKVDQYGLFTSSQVTFNDEGVAHSRFWLKYKRPPVKEYQEFILNRRDLLVPQDIRERKGSFFTPKIWVEKAQEYLEMQLGENWQDEYYVWDCCAGTGNLPAGLTNKYNIYVSTLDKSDVDVIHERIEKGANLLHEHVFKFDFLNDGFKTVNGNLVDDLCHCDKLPESLRDILQNEDKRKRLVLLENPPYAEAGDAKQSHQTGRNKKGVAVTTKAYKYYTPLVGKATQELFAQFIIRQFHQIPGCVIGQFSKLKMLQSQNFVKFRSDFTADLKSLFLVPSNTFDNVKGKFPIGFFIWKTNETRTDEVKQGDVYDYDGAFLGTKRIIPLTEYDTPLTKWLSSFRSGAFRIGDINQGRNDFQNQNYCYIKYNVPDHRFGITRDNFDKCAIYFAVRKVIPADWLNDRDQFFKPSIEYENDKVFISDCITYTLFSNNISIAEGENHWIPFSEDEVNSRERFKSHFMHDYLNGRLTPEDGEILSINNCQPIEFSEKAKAVFDAGRELWKYYQSKADCIPDAGLLDIRMYFQGVENGRMNASSVDTEYTRLIGILRERLEYLAEEIEPKIWEYGFLKR